MKKIYPLILLLAIAMSTSQTNAQTLNQGLIARYCLNGDAQDAAGTKHGILMNGAASAMDRANNPNGAISLDGIDDFIQLPSDNWLTGDFTFSGWINIKTVGSWPHLWGFGNGTNAENVFLGLGQATNNIPHFTTHDCTNGGVGNRAPATSTSPLNTWFHIVVTLSGSNVTLYKDNQVWGGGTMLSTPCAVNKDSAFIGKSNFTFNNNALVHADVDDFRFYDRVLTPAEIGELYESEEVNQCLVGSPNSTSYLKQTMHRINIFPNPNTGHFKIQPPKNKKIFQLKIYDQVGSLLNFERVGNEIKLPKNVSMGTYHILGYLQDGSLFTSKLLIQ